MGKVTAFILSHNRSSSCPTLDLLNKLNYSGDYKIVIDDEDKELELYKEKYKDHLLIFNKMDYAYIDTGYDSEHFPKSTPIFAREFINCYAYNNKVGNYLMLDDDIQRIKFRIPDYNTNSLPGYHITNIDDLLDYLFDFMDNDNIYTIGFCHQGEFVGGIQSFNEEKILGKRAICQIFLFNSKKKFDWKLVWYEDYNSCYYNGIRGQLTFKIPFIGYETELTGNDNKSTGMGECYKDNIQLNRAFYRVMLFPSACVVREHRKQGNFLPFIKADAILPKIISGRFKK